jgi:hypothetical protein
MSMAKTIQALRLERCNVAEIAAAVGYRERTVAMLLGYACMSSTDRIVRAFRGWRACIATGEVHSW